MLNPITAFKIENGKLNASCQDDLFWENLVFQLFLVNSLEHRYNDMKVINNIVH